MTKCLMCEKSLRRRTRASYRMLINANIVGYHADYLCFDCLEHIAQQVRQIYRIVANLFDIYLRELRRYHTMTENPQVLTSLIEFTWPMTSPGFVPAKMGDKDMLIGPMVLALLLAEDALVAYLNGDDFWFDRQYQESHCRIVAQLIAQSKRS